MGEERSPFEPSRSSEVRNHGESPEKKKRKPNGIPPYEVNVEGTTSEELDNIEIPDVVNENDQELRRLNAIARLCSIADPCSAVVELEGKLLVAYNGLHEVLSNKNESTTSRYSHLNGYNINLGSHFLDNNKLERKRKLYDEFRKIEINKIKKSFPEIIGKDGGDSRPNDEALDALLNTIFDFAIRLKGKDYLQHVEPAVSEISKNLYGTRNEQIKSLLNNVAFSGTIDKLIKHACYAAVDFKKATSYIRAKKLTGNISLARVDSENVHAEMRLISKIFRSNNYDIKKILDSGPFQIGIRKLCCANCSHVINEINSLFEEKIKTDPELNAKYNGTSFIHYSGHHSIKAGLTKWQSPEFCDIGKFKKQFILLTLVEKLGENPPLLSLDEGPPNDYFSITKKIVDKNKEIISSNEKKSKKKAVSSSLKLVDLIKENFRKKIMGSGEIKNLQEKFKNEEPKVSKAEEKMRIELEVSKQEETIIDELRTRFLKKSEGYSDPFELDSWLDNLSKNISTDSATKIEAIREKGYHSMYHDFSDSDAEDSLWESDSSEGELDNDSMPEGETKPFSLK